MHEDDLELINSCKKGDKEAFRCLYELYSKEAFRTAYLIIGRRETSEDTVQETFIYCFKNIKSLKKAEMFKSWMYKILVRTAWRMTKKEYKHFDRECIENFIDDIVDKDRSVQELVTDRETSREVYNAIKSLTPTLREVVVLYYYNGMTVKEISILLECRVGTIKSRLFNARKALSCLLDSDYVRFNSITNIKEENCYNE